MNCQLTDAILGLRMLLEKWKFVIGWSFTKICQSNAMGQECKKQQVDVKL